ncbi:hypothetical protein BDB01DRAFT_773758 [Pilobolus umbonatus]|nr:hypothetical protein BDB01DRAFT_773758 [Pilobolus umbonatus]
MFVPTIKYKRVDQCNNTIEESSQSDTNKSSSGYVKYTATSDNVESNKNAAPVEMKSMESNKNTAHAKELVEETQHSNTDIVELSEYSFIFQEEEDKATIVVDPEDDERIIVTLSTGKQYSTDRYCPHAGADLSCHGKVNETDYPPEIGPTMMCRIHYWEFALEKGGRGGRGFMTINACSIDSNKCKDEHRKLEW